MKDVVNRRLQYKKKQMNERWLKPSKVYYSSHWQNTSLLKRNIQFSMKIKKYKKNIVQNASWNPQAVAGIGVPWLINKNW